LLEDVAEARALSRVQGAEPCHAAAQVRAKIGVTIAILARRTMAAAIVEGGAQALDLVARCRELFVHDDSGDPLPRARGHDAFLAEAQREALVACDTSAPR